MHFELGGKNPVVVFADADLERAADAATFMIYSLNGERCTSSSRLLVEEPIYEKFTAAIAEKAKRIKIGHPLDPDTVIGPLIHPTHEKKVLEYFAIGQREGATIAAGGGTVDGPGGGCYVAPTLFTGAVRIQNCGAATTGSAGSVPVGKAASDSALIATSALKFSFRVNVATFPGSFKKVDRIWGSVAGTSLITLHLIVRWHFSAWKIDP